MITYPCCSLTFMFEGRVYWDWWWCVNWVRLPLPWASCWYYSNGCTWVSCYLYHVLLFATYVLMNFSLYLVGFIHADKMTSWNSWWNISFLFSTQLLSFTLTYRMCAFVNIIKTHQNIIEHHHSLFHTQILMQ